MQSKFLNVRFIADSSFFMGFQGFQYLFFIVGINIKYSKYLQRRQRNPSPILRITFHFFDFISLTSLCKSIHINNCIDLQDKLHLYLDITAIPEVCHQSSHQSLVCTTLNAAKRDAIMLQLSFHSTKLRKLTKPFNLTAKQANM